MERPDILTTQKSLSGLKAITGLRMTAQSQRSSAIAVVFALRNAPTGISAARGYPNLGTC